MPPLATRGWWSGVADERARREAHQWLPSDALQDVIIRSGFTINPRKTRFMYRNSRQEVTRLVANQKISVRSDYRHDVRAMVHRLVTSGAFEIYGSVMKDGTLTMDKRAGTRSEVVECGEPAHKPIESTTYSFENSATR